MVGTDFIPKPLPVGEEPGPLPVVPRWPGNGRSLSRDREVKMYTKREGGSSVRGNPCGFAS